MKIMGWFYHGVLLFLLGLTTLGHLASAETSTATAPAAASTKVMGLVELRPGYWVGENKFTNDTTLMLGYQFTPDVKVTYWQGVANDLLDQSGKLPNLTPRIDGAFLSTSVGKIWQNGSDLDAGYENRVYFPTDSASRSAGMIAIMRNYVKLNKKFSPAFTLTMSEIPIVAAYSKRGTVDDTGKALANPYFENRVYLIGSVQMTEKLSLTVPLMFHVTRTHGFAGASNSNSWTYKLWAWPELGYQLTSNTNIGVAFMTSNLITSNLSGLNIGDGLSKGALQVFVGATL